MIKVKVFLKSGNSFEFLSEKIKATANNHSGDLANLKWKNVEGENRLLYVDLNSVETITYQEIKKVEKELTKEESLKIEKKCRCCRYADLTDEELDRLGGDPCDTCIALSEWKPKED